MIIAITIDEDLAEARVRNPYFGNELDTLRNLLISEILARIREYEVTRLYVAFVRMDLPDDRLVFAARVKIRGGERIPSVDRFQNDVLEGFTTALNRLDVRCRIDEPRLVSVEVIRSGMRIEQIFPVTI